jgi:hypothetical protein
MSVFGGVPKALISSNKNFSIKNIGEIYILWLENLNSSHFFHQ